MADNCIVVQGLSKSFGDFLLDNVSFNVPTIHLYAQSISKGDGIIMGFFLKHPRFWGSLFITIAMIGSNVGSAWAGGEYRLLSTQPPWQNSAPACVGFQVLMYTVYPLTIALLALGVYLWSRHKRP